MRPTAESYENFDRFAFQICIDFFRNMPDTNPSQLDLYRCYVVKSVLRMFSGVPLEKINHYENDLGIKIPAFDDWVIQDIHKLEDK